MDEENSMLFDRLRTICQSLYLLVFCIFVLIYWMLLWQAHLSCLLSIPSFYHGPLGQADSYSCLFSLKYKARVDKCKHLTEYPPHLGSLSVVFFVCVCLCFFLNPMRWISSCLQSFLLGPLLLSHFTQIHFHQSVNGCYYGRSQTLLG